MLSCRKCRNGADFFSVAVHDIAHENKVDIANEDRRKAGAKPPKVQVTITPHGVSFTDMYVMFLSIAVVFLELLAQCLT